MKKLWITRMCCDYVGSLCCVGIMLLLTILIWQEQIVSLYLLIQLKEVAQIFFFIFLLWTLFADNNKQITVSPSNTIDLSVLSPEHASP